MVSEKSGRFLLFFADYVLHKPLRREQIKCFSPHFGNELPSAGHFYPSAAATVQEAFTHRFICVFARVVVLVVTPVNSISLINGGHESDQSKYRTWDL